MDAGNMLKPALARGELRVVGATTLDEYRKHIEKDRGARAALPAGLRGRAERGGHRSPSCAGSRSATRCTTACASPTRAIVAAATLSRPLHRRPLPPRQGDRPDRRGGQPAAHRDRLHAAGDRRGGAPHHAAGDRAAGAAEGEGPGVAGAAASAWSASSPSCASAAVGDEGAVAVGEGDASGAVGRDQGGARAGAQSRPSRPPARATSNRAAEIRYGRIPAAASGRMKEAEQNLAELQTDAASS